MKRVYQIFAGTQKNLFKQISEHIGYFESLHITDIWLTPIWESPSYHAYDASDHLTIKKDIGTMEEFTDMCNLLHKHNIKVMFDLVPCHVSVEHHWFKEHPEYFMWSIEKRGVQKAYGNFDQSSENAWHWNEERQMFYYAPFSECMPALNLDNEEVRELLAYVAKYWLRHGVDCFRLDAIMHSHLHIDDSVNFFKWFKEQVPVYMVGEAWTNYNTIQKYNEAIDSCFDFPLQSNLIWSTRNLDFLGVASDLNRTSPNLMLFTSNHDMNRVGQVLEQDTDKIKLYLWLNLLFAQGQHCLYYMDEIGISGDKSGGDIYVRPEIDWNKISTQLFTTDSILREYIRAVGLIDKHKVLSEGKIIRVECQYEYSRLAVYKEYKGKRVKIKIQPSSRNLDKMYTVASFCGYDIVIVIHETV